MKDYFFVNIWENYMRLGNKKILIITTIAGFLPQFEMNNVKVLKELGYEVQYATNFKNPVYSIDLEKMKKQDIILHQIDIQKKPTHISENFKAFRQIKRIIEQEQIDVIHCHNPMGGVVGRLASFFSKRKVYTVYTAHGFHFYKGAPVMNWLIYYNVERLLAGITNQLITINHEDYMRAGRFKLAKNGHVDIIPGVGLDESRYYRDSSLREPMRQELNIPENTFHLVSVGELVANKNHEIIIRAMSKLKDSDIFYSICGKGPELERLKEIAHQLKLENRVRFLGYRTDVEKVLQSADCFAFPSVREGLGMASIEAMACEVPLIVADNRGTREYTEAGINGLLCSATDVDAFADAIKYIKDHPKVRAEMGSNGGNISRKFRLAETEKTMRMVYERIFEENISR